jgi:flavin reductase (DIM6/NTAB) family NADH-FMN oxidoreductase RutF
MPESFTRIDPRSVTDNPFELIGAEWMLITAGTPDRFNTMTASWGGVGVIWNRNICWCVIRPQRYTYEFMEKAESFTLSFFEEKYRPALQLCGSKSGRDIDKAAAAGLTPIGGILPGTTAFEEARMVAECRKIYFQDLNPQHFLDAAIDENYPARDYHRMYFGEIVNWLVKQT